MLDQVSLSGTEDVIIQLGDSGGFKTSGYLSGISEGTFGDSRTDGFQVTVTVVGTDLCSGVVTIVRIDGNTWVSAGNISESTGLPDTKVSAGTVTLDNELTQLRVTRTGADTFDAGKVNIFTE